MNRQVPKNVRKTAGVLMLTGVMAIGAFSLLKTGVLSTNVNKIATVAGTTEGDGTGGEGELPDGGETGGGTTKPETGTDKFGLIIEHDTQVIDLDDALPHGTGGEGELPDGGETGGGTTKPETGTDKFGLIIEHDTQVIDLDDALPQTKAAALANNTPHTFTIRNKGTVEQVVRLSMAGITKDLEKTELPADKVNKAAALANNTPHTFTIRNKGTVEQVVRLSMAGITKDLEKTELPADKVNVLVRIKDGAEVTEAKTTLATIRTAGKAGYGNCFKLAGGAAKEFELFAWIDENASLADLYGADGKTSKQIKFQAGASAVQADAFTNQNEGTEMNKEFGQLVGAAQQ